MAHYDDRTETNWLTKQEKRIRKSVNFLLIICLIDFALLIFSPIRNYHFTKFPNFHLIGFLLLFTIVLVRLFQAKNEGKDPYMEASREWRQRKDMISAYDYGGPEPDYSNKKYNTLYYIGIVLGFSLIFIEILKNLGFYDS